MKPTKVKVVFDYEVYLDQNLSPEDQISNVIDAILDDGIVDGDYAETIRFFVPTQEPEPVYVVRRLSDGQAIRAAGNTSGYGNWRYMSNKTPRLFRKAHLVRTSLRGRGKPVPFDFEVVEYALVPTGKIISQEEILKGTDL